MVRYGRKVACKYIGQLFVFVLMAGAIVSDMLVTIHVAVASANSCLRLS